MSLLLLLNRCRQHGEYAKTRFGRMWRNRCTSDDDDDDDDEDDGEDDADDDADDPRGGGSR